MTAPAPPKPLAHDQLEFDRVTVSAITDGPSLAAHLGVSWSFIKFHLFWSPLHARYSEFKIAKRSGGDRTILAPRRELKHLQRLILGKILRKIFKPKSCAHGFVTDRSIVTGASRHVRTRWILNTDLEDFFPSINFGRVFGMLKAPPYSLQPKVAAWVAHACCYKGHLPQGAPTSPMISNMICARLDTDLSKFAAQHQMVYTRYADDITFSTFRKVFPETVAPLLPDSSENTNLAGSALERIITSNGFRINHKKTRLKQRTQRLEVTGLVVNRKVNIPREYLRDLRAALHALSIYGEDAETMFRDKFNRTNSRSLKATLAGRLDYVRQIRGSLDSTYLRLAQKAHEIDAAFFKLPDGADHLDFVTQRTWVIESADLAAENAQQGSGFFLKNVGLITCSHVLSGEMIAYRCNAPHKKFPLSIVKNDPRLDLAVLTIEGLADAPAFEMNSTHPLRYNDQISVCGFPNYGGSSTPVCAPGNVIGKKTANGTARIIVSAQIIQGTSGGPVLDAERRVVAIAATGSGSSAEPSREVDSSAILISELHRLLA